MINVYFDLVKFENHSQCNSMLYIERGPSFSSVASKPQRKERLLVVQSIKVQTNFLKDVHKMSTQHVYTAILVQCIEFHYMVLL